MGSIFTKAINSYFFRTWNSEMSYVLGYITADGCISIDKRRKDNPLTLNITSVEKKHLYRIRKAFSSTHKISKKPGGYTNVAYQFQARNPIITQDLIKLGILPRKSHNLGPIKVPNKYFSDFVRGFFDGDGTVYIYTVNGTPQIKAGFVSSSLPFITRFNQQLCENLNIPTKSIHKEVDKRKSRMARYNICFYIDDCEKLANFMYENSLTLFLPRKHRIFKKWKSMKRRHYVKQNYPSKIGWRLNEKVIA
ncbi:MAG: LAGLIDADG family homing endonuclease [Candidatus Paceibacterota bacterium]|jgi:hypothetical protein